MLAVAVAPAVFIFLVVLGLLYIQSKSDLRNDLNAHGEKILATISLSTKHALEPEDATILTGFIAGLLDADKSIAEIKIVDYTGRNISVVSSELLSPKVVWFNKEIPFIYSDQEEKDASRTAGTVWVAIAVDRFAEENRMAIFNILILVLSGCLLSAIFAVKLTFRVRKQVGMIASALHQLKDGSFTLNPNKRKSGELGSLLEIIGETAASLNQQRELQEHYQKSLTEAISIAEKASAAKSRFLAAASHDLRQPTTSMQLYLDSLDRYALPGQKKIISNMQVCINAMGLLLGNLLEMSKLQIKKVPVKFQCVSLKSIFNDVRARLQPAADDKGLSFRIRDSEVMIQTDIAILTRIIDNLVLNAITYTKTGGVLVACRRKSGSLWIEVWDTGVGIAPEHETSIFEEFFQIGDDSRTSSQGSGLGLAIVAKSAKFIHSRIRFKSHLGRGSMFAVEVFSTKEKSIPLTLLGQDLIKKPGKPYHIAVVDDSSMVLDSISKTLALLGHTVYCGRSWEDLLDSLGNESPDVLITDYRLGGGINGLKIIEMLRSKLGRVVPAVLITGDTDPNIMEKISDSGIEVLYKPLRIQDLIKSVEFVIDAEKEAASS